MAQGPLPGDLSYLLCARYLRAFLRADPRSGSVTPPGDIGRQRPNVEQRNLLLGTPVRTWPGRASLYGSGGSGRHIDGHAAGRVPRSVAEAPAGVRGLDGLCEGATPWGL
jgi:hypothetical protein